MQSCLEFTRFRDLHWLQLFTLSAFLATLQWRAIDSAQCASCLCNQTAAGDQKIICWHSALNTTVDILISPHTLLEVTCDAHAPDATEMIDLIPQPAVGTITFTTINNCLPFDNILTRLGARPRQYFELHGPASWSELTRQHLRALMNVRVLEISRVSRIADDALADCENLHLLKLSVELLEPHAQPFKSLSKLRDLTLSANLTHLPVGIFRNLWQLKKLTLWGNHLHSLNQSDFQDLPLSLTELYLNSNEIEFLSADVFALQTQLKRLTLANNNLRKLPPRLFARQRSLYHLGLRNVGLESLPVQLFEANVGLQELILSQNKLTFIAANTFSTLRNLWGLHLDRNRLKSIEPGAFAQLRRLRELLLNDNQLHIPTENACALFRGPTGLSQLDLSNNRLTDMCSQENLTKTYTAKLKTLNLSNNMLTRLSVGFMRALNNSASLQRLNLLKNPWACDCEAGELLHFIKANQKRLIDVKELVCADASLPKFIELNFFDMCVPELGVELGVVMAMLSVFAFTLVVSSAAVLYYKYQLELKVWLYAHNSCLWCVTEQELDREKRFDAFISYSHKDEQFIVQQLLPGLENGPTPFKVCIHVRDWLVGAFIPEQIVDSVEQSRRTIIVLSQNFIESDWALMEFRTAHQCALNERRARLILIVYGEITDTTALHPELQAYLKMNTYLKWDDPWFWNKLRYAMPHSARRLRRATKPVVTADVDVEMKTVGKS